MHCINIIFALLLGAAICKDGLFRGHILSAVPQRSLSVFSSLTYFNILEILYMYISCIVKHYMYSENYQMVETSTDIKTNPKRVISDVPSTSEHIFLTAISLLWFNSSITLLWIIFYESTVVMINPPNRNEATLEDILTVRELYQVYNTFSSLVLIRSYNYLRLPLSKTWHVYCPYDRNRSKDNMILLNDLHKT